MSKFVQHYWDAVTIGFTMSLLNVEFIQQLLLSIISITLTIFGKYAAEMQIRKWKNSKKDD